MEFFLNNNNNNKNTNTNNTNNFKQNYGDNKRHILQSSTMTENKLQNDDTVFAEFVDTENDLMKVIKKQTNDNNWDLLEKLLEDGFEYEEALEQINKRTNENTYKNNERNYNKANQMTFNRSFIHPSVANENNNSNNNFKENTIRQNQTYNTTKDKTDSFSFGDFLSTNNNNFRNHTDNDKSDPPHKDIELDSRRTNRDNRDSFLTLEVPKQDEKCSNTIIKKSEARTTYLRREDVDFSDYNASGLSYADRRKLNILLDDGLKYEEALSYVLKQKDEKPTHTVTNSSQLNEFSNRDEFDNENWRRTRDVDTRENMIYEETFHDDDVALIDEEIKRKRLELEEYENRLLRYSKRIIQTESSRSPSPERIEEDNYFERKKPRSLSGAGRKRLKILITQGLKYQEALSIVINERIERERRNGLRNEIIIKREDLDDRNDITYKKRRFDSNREDYIEPDQFSFNNDHSKRIRRYSSSQEKDSEEQILLRRLEENERAKPLSGAGRKRISRLVADGMPIQKARAIVVQERDERNARLVANRKLTRFGPNKNIQTMNDSKQRQTGIKVYIHTRNYPDELLDNDELYILKKAILHELDKVSPRAPQVRFLSCVFKLGWLQIICADDYSCDWLASIMKTIRPWRGAVLKMIVSGQSTVMVNISESDSCQKILDKLKKQNEGLRTENWIILRNIKTKKANLYIFDIDDFSLETLERNNWTAYYGLGKVRFRFKNNIGREPIPYDIKNSTESRQRSKRRLDLDDRASNIRSERRLTHSYSPGIRGSDTSSKHSFH